MESWRRENNVDKWTKAQAILYQVRNTGLYSQARVSGISGLQPAQSISNPSYTSAPVRSGFTNNSIGRYDPYAPPRVPPPSMGASSSSLSKPVIQFKPSPFFRTDQAVSGTVECPESTSSTDRKQQTLTFTLNSEHTTKLNQTSPKYQLRLYCTTSTFYSPNHGFRLSGPCPIEFPPTCEVRVNGVALQGSLKGLKKKPGTAPPPDLGKTVRMTGQNRVEMVYVNSQQPVQPKKFYLTVFLVEVTTVAQLVDKLKKGKYRSCEDIMAQMSNKASGDDDDIVAGPQKMSLKCPLSFMRIQTPCRSALCVHPQCFDATSWFSCMEQTTTFLCPVCEKMLNPEDLIIDGYFNQILGDTPESVDDVIVENDGQWHTSDDRYASAIWRASHPHTAPHDPTPPRASTPASEDEAESKELVKRSIEVLILDSDEEEEEEGRVKRELSVSQGSIPNSLPKVSLPRGAPAVAPQPRRDDVIDLTVDSDEEQSQSQSPARPGEKRKAPSGTQSPTEQIWKKSRLESVVPRGYPSSSSSGGSGSSTAQISPVSPTTSTTHPRPAPYGPGTASYSGPTLPPLRLPSGGYPPQTAPPYRPPIAPPVPRENTRPYDHYGGDYYSRPSGPSSRSSAWPS